MAYAIALTRVTKPLLSQAVPNSSGAATTICFRCQTAFFSTTSSLYKRTRDRNRNRGVSALRRTGPRYPLPIASVPLPVPVLDPARRSKVEVNENHGLWDFFDKDKMPFEKPEDVASHGLQSSTCI